MKNITAAKLRKTRLSVLTICLFISLCLPGYSIDWQDEEKSTHFIVYYQSADTDTDYIDKVVRKAESCYDDITDYLGFRRYNFWKWDNRCKIYIYPSPEAYMQDSGMLEWSSGSVHIHTKEISSFIKKDRFLDYILPHELGHIIFREFIGFDKQIPLWLDEGVAVLQEKDRITYTQIAKEIITNNNHMHIGKISSINNYDQIDPRAFYSQSASMVKFLIDKFGKDSFMSFCRKLRDKPGWIEQLKSEYRFKTLSEFEESWLEWLRKQ